MPFFSIIIPVYNRESLVMRAINSCLDQTFTDFEIKVIDDCSTDNTFEVLKKITDSRVNIFRNDINMGVCPTRQKGIDASKGEWILLLDSDNELYENALESLKNTIDQLPCNIGYLSTLFQYTSGFSKEDYQKVKEGDYSYIEFLKALDEPKPNIEGPPCIKKSVLDIVKYSKGLRSCEVEFLFDMMKCTVLRQVNTIVGVYHIDANNRLSNKFNILRDAESLMNSTENLLKKHESAIEEYAPLYLKKRKESLLFYYLIVYPRNISFKHCMKYFKEYRYDIKTICAFLLGMISKRLMINVAKFITKQLI